MTTATTSSRGVRLLAAEVLLLAGLLVSLGAGLSMVLGPNGLALLNFEPRWPVVGTSQYEMSIQTQFDPATPVVVKDAPRWRDTPRGTVDAKTGGPPVEVTGPFLGQVGFPGPSPAQRWSWVLWRSATPLLTAGALWLALLIVRSVRGGDPFTTTNARRLRLLAVLVALGGTLVSLLGAVLRRWLLDSSGAKDIVVRDWSISLVPLLVGVLVWVLAQVWSHGAAMKNDLDGVV